MVIIKYSFLSSFFLFLSFITKDGSIKISFLLTFAFVVAFVVAFSVVILSVALLIVLALLSVVLLIVAPFPIVYLPFRINNIYFLNKIKKI